MTDWFDRNNYDVEDSFWRWWRSIVESEDVEQQFIICFFLAEWKIVWLYYFRLSNRAKFTYGKSMIATIRSKFIVGTIRVQVFVVCLRESIAIMAWVCLFVYISLVFHLGLYFIILAVHWFILICPFVLVNLLL